MPHDPQTAAAPRRPVTDGRVQGVGFRASIGARFVRLPAA